MSADEDTQSGYEDGMGGPGAPTSLSALEVAWADLFALALTDNHTGHQWVDESRYQAVYGRRLQHCRVRRLYTKTAA